MEEEKMMSVKDQLDEISTNKVKRTLKELYNKELPDWISYIIIWFLLFIIESFSDFKMAILFGLAVLIVRSFSK